MKRRNAAPETQTTNRAVCIDVRVSAIGNGRTMSYMKGGRQVANSPNGREGMASTTHLRGILWASGPTR